MLALKKIGDGAFHVFSEGYGGGMLSRYGILNDSLSESYAECSAELSGNEVLMHGAKRDVSVSVSVMQCGGYRLDIPLSEKERFYGMGDANRDSVTLRGRSIGVWVANVSSYGPMPVLLSSDGWAIVVNSTYRQKFDIGESDRDLLSIYVKKDKPDFYLFTAKTLKDTVREITDVSGKPAMLPAFGYGLTFVENEESTDARTLLNDIRTMRDRGIPCDVFGLEPSWMSVYYDFSVDKKWDSKKFRLPSWLPSNNSSASSFLGPIRFMGMQLSLWLCEDYDLFYEEERHARDDQRAEADVAYTDNEEAFNKNVDFIDEHLVASAKTDNITKPEEPWFEHLKKFVDNGAACFKLDGSNQVLEHPQRLWAKKFFDDEAHNAYPLVLAKQMHEGFRAHTGRRSMIYTSGAYLGTQKYAATWAGDTGGGPRTLVSCLNYAMCGHTNTTCDMDVYNPFAVHYAFLSTWTQINSWAYYRHPWFLPKSQEDLIRNYSLLRSSLFPYIYTAAHFAAESGVPIMRPLVLEFEDEKFDAVKNAYMLGSDLYVGAFDMELTLPDGEWVDYFTGKIYSGSFKYEIPEGRSGALLARRGSIIPTMEPQQYVAEKEHDYLIRVYPGRDAECDLYEDDEFTYDYENGKYAVTHFAMKDNGDSGCALTVFKRVGSFAGAPENGHNLYGNSIPKIEGIRPLKDMKIQILDKRARSVSLDGKAVEVVSIDGGLEFTVKAEEHESRELVYEIDY